MSSTSLLSRPVQWPAISRDELSNRNVLCRHRDPWTLTWLDREWQMNLHPLCPVLPAVRYLEVEWGGAKVVIGLSQTTIDLVCAAALPGEPVLQWPRDVAMAAIEFSAELLSVAIETVSRKSLLCAGWGESRPAAAGMERLGWSARSGDTVLEGEIWLDAVACRFLAAQLRDCAAATGGADARWDALPLSLPLVIGWVDLPAGQLGEIGLRDVLVLDECLLGAEGAEDRLLLCLGNRLAIACHLRGRELHVIEGVNEIMSDPTAPGTVSHLLDDIPVRLSFDVGEREITLGDLRSVQPGYVFNLGRDPKSLVSIRANGRLVGEGELVDIEGRLGVAVLRFHPEGQ